MDHDGAEAAGCLYADFASETSQFPAGALSDQTVAARDLRLRHRC